VTKERLYLESVERFLPAPKKIIMDGGDSKVLPLLPLTGMERLTTPGPVGRTSTSEKKGN